MSRGHLPLSVRLARLGVCMASLAVRAGAPGVVSLAGAQDAPSEGAASGSSAAATMAGFQFQPAELAVKVGDTVVWTNSDSAPHTSTSLDGIWDTGTLSNGQSGAFTFTMPGTFAYRCNIHQAMRGTVTVTE